MTISFIILPRVFCSENDEAIIQQGLQLTLCLYFFPFLEHKRRNKECKKRRRRSAFNFFILQKLNNGLPHSTSNYVSLCSQRCILYWKQKTWHMSIGLFRVMGQKTYIPEFTFAGLTVRFIVRIIRDKRSRWAWNAAWMRKAENIWIRISLRRKILDEAICKTDKKGGYYSARSYWNALQTCNSDYSRTAQRSCPVPCYD